MWLLLIGTRMTSCWENASGGADRIDRQGVRDLVDGKTPLLLNDLPDGDKGWKVHYALFTRSGFTPTAKTKMQQKAGLLVDLKALDGVLGRA